MIIQWLLQLLGSALHGLMSAMPHVTVPAWLSSISGPVSTVFAQAASMGVWFPMSLLGTVLVAVFAAWGVGLGIKLVRIVASFLTLGGGSAA